MRIRGSRVVVTGASSGIGRHAAAELAAKGAEVLAVARSEAALKELARTRANIYPFVADLSDPAQRAELVEGLGPVDVLVNNAGVGWLGLVEAMPYEQVRHLFEVNVLAGIDLTLRILPGMLARRRGRIVNISSASAWAAFPPLSVYASTKSALQGFSQGLRRELAGRGVAVTTINPGPTATRFAAAGRDTTRLSDDLPDKTMAGVPVSWVTRAILKGVRYGTLPGYRTIAVPRLMGLARLDALPLLQWPGDLASVAVRRRAGRGAHLQAPGLFPTQSALGPR